MSDTICPLSLFLPKVDTFRVKIWQTSDDTVVYDNQPDESDDSNVGTAIGGGNIQVHSSCHLRGIDDE